MAAIDTSMYWPKIETPGLKCNADLAGPTIIIAGIIVSLWSYCIFITAITDHFMGPCDEFIVFIGFLTHVIISLSTTETLLTGFKRNDPDCLKPWMYFKAIEITGILVGMMVLLSPYSYSQYIGMIPVGIIFLLIISYLFVCILTAYKKMKNNPQPPPATKNLDSVVLDKPLTCDG